MTDRTIDVCQDCGEYIEPIPVPATDKVFVYCVSEACTDRRAAAAWVRFGPVVGSGEIWDWRVHAMLPIVDEPRTIRITGLT